MLASHVGVIRGAHISSPPPLKTPAWEASRIMFLFSLVGIPHQIESYSFSIDKLYSGDHSLEGTALTVHTFLAAECKY